MKPKTQTHNIEYTRLVPRPVREAAGRADAYARTIPQTLFARQAVLRVVPGLVQNSPVAAGPYVTPDKARPLYHSSRSRTASRGGPFSSKDYQPWLYIRRIAATCIVLFLAWHAWIITEAAASGRARELPAFYRDKDRGVVAGLYQAIKCGPASHVNNPWTCD